MCELTGPESSPEALFAAVLAKDPARPLLTFYDDATGERAELSASSTANWVAKTYFLLRDELGLTVGDRALVALPPHWLTPIVWLACWAAGLTVVSAGPAQIAFVGPDGGAPDGVGPDGGGPDGGAADADDVYALSLRPWGQGFEAAPPPGTQDFVAAVRPHGDLWAQVSFPAGPADAALADLSRADLVTAMSAIAVQTGMERSSRVMAHHTEDAAPSVSDLLVPLSAGASLVLVRHAASPPTEDPRLQQEHVTHVL